MLAVVPVEASPTSSGLLIEWAADADPAGDWALHRKSRGEQDWNEMTPVHASIPASARSYLITDHLPGDAFEYRVSEPGGDEGYGAAGEVGGGGGIADDEDAADVGRGGLGAWLALGR